MSNQTEENTKDFISDLMGWFEIENNQAQKVAYALILTRTTREYKHTGDTTFVCAVMKHGGEWGYYPFDTMPKMMDFAKDYLVFGNADSDFVQRRVWEELASSAHDELEYNGMKRSPIRRKKSLIKEIAAVLHLLRDEVSLLDILDYVRELVTKEAQISE